MSKAQELADRLDREYRDDALNYDTAFDAAEELRRLEAENAACMDNLLKVCSHELALIAANKELLEALKLADALLWGANMNAHVVEEKVRAAIQKHGRGA